MSVRDWPGDRPSAESPHQPRFRVHGSGREHDAHELCVTATLVEFETDYAVAPGSRLRLAAGPGLGDPGFEEVGVEVSRVDSRPGSRFRVSGRLQRNR